MIGALRGSPVQVDKNTILVFAGGVGYEVKTTENDALEAVKHHEVLVHVVFCLKQDKIEIFGFLQKGDKDLFNIFTCVSGVGGKTALIMIDSKQVVGDAIAQDSALILSRIPGIGKKTAEKLLVELRNNKKLILPTASCSNYKIVEEAVSVLVNLGINKSLASRLVQQAMADSPNISLEEIVRNTLAMAR